MTPRQPPTTKHILILKCLSGGLFAGAGRRCLVPSVWLQAAVFAGVAVRWGGTTTCSGTTT